MVSEDWIFWLRTCSPGLLRPMFPSVSSMGASLPDGSVRASARSPVTSRTVGDSRPGAPRRAAGLCRPDAAGRHQGRTGHEARSEAPGEGEEAGGVGAEQPDAGLRGDPAEGALGFPPGRADLTRPGPDPKGAGVARVRAAGALDVRLPARPRPAGGGELRRRAGGAAGHPALPRTYRGRLAPYRAGHLSPWEALIERMRLTYD